MNDNPPVAELARRLRAKDVSSVEATGHFLDRIERLGGALNAFISIDPEKSLAQARAADERIARGEGHALTGVPLAHKDLFCTRGWRTTCGARMLADFVAPYDAHVIEQFDRAGAVLLGKTNMDEFAMGSSNENSFFGPVRNPWDLKAVPGGSSGGSAAAVAARLVPGATGTDTGGSIRQPASFTGVSGIKPTYGRVSRYGMVAFASSLDQGGPLGQSAQDLALMLDVMAGFDARDSTSVERPKDDYVGGLARGVKGLRLGIPREYFSADLAPDVAGPIRAAISELEKLGCRTVEVSLPNQHFAVPVYYVIAPAEASSNLARYDGVRYGLRVDGDGDLVSMYTNTRHDGFGPEVKRRIMLGTYALSSGYYDAYYGRAQQVRTKIADDFKAAFETFDFVVTPTAPTVAFKLGEKLSDPLRWPR